MYFYLLFVIFSINFLINYKKSFSYPQNFLFIVYFFYFAFKYYLYHIFKIEPLDNLALEDLNNSGFYLFLFFLPLISISNCLNFLYSQKKLPLLFLSERFSFEKASYLFIFGNILLLAVIGGPDILFRPLKIRNIMTGQGMYYLSYLIQFLSTFVSLKLLEQKKYKRLIIFSLIFSIFGFISGRASLQINYILGLLLFLGMYHRKNLFKYLLILSIPMAIYVIVTGFYRDITYASSLSNEEVKEAFSYQSSSSESVLKIFVTKVLYRIDNLESFSLLVKDLENNKLDYSYGVHMSSFFNQWIPRAAWEDKPLNFTAEMTKRFRPEVYYEGNGNNFSGIGEILYNFGAPGIIIFGCLFGLLFHFSSIIWESAKHNFVYSFVIIFIVYPYFNLAVLAGPINDLGLPLLLLGTFFMVTCLKIKRLNIPKNIPSNINQLNSLN